MPLCHPVIPYRHPGLDPGSLQITDDAATGDCGSEPAMTGLFYRCCATCAVIPYTPSSFRMPLCHTIIPYRHPGCGSGSAMTDPGSLRTIGDAVPGDCGSEPAMTFFFYHCCATCAVIPYTPSSFRMPLCHTIIPYRHPGCGSGSAMTDPGSLRTIGDAVPGDCGSEPAMTGLFYRCCVTCAVIPYAPSSSRLRIGVRNDGSGVSSNHR
jgi:hypothetical protein